MALGTKLFLVLNGFPNVSRVGSTYSIGEKPTVILSTYILTTMQRHQNKNKEHC